ncbi:uncharacterized protein DUF1127 [Aliiruegeria haliotis]|uniref:Uncharacterized protein DUF1127 n=1 Tax=Aliiruegeria haliotis TaxID=1280846 RepID=A0A2T0RXS5_9RHOB|nr:DUF1127 domain-containing protein [Aliiruegeria haliotis]PRY25985.1 uncharacterized protein DUF1127 [Aliiruegeria haliotis]
MTYVSEAPRAEAGLRTGWFTDMVKGYSARVAQYRAYRKTLEELRCMTEAELADIGLSRLVIKDVAKQAAGLA